MAKRVINNPNLKIEVEDGVYIPYVKDNGDKKFVGIIPPVATNGNLAIINARINYAIALNGNSQKEKALELLNSINEFLLLPEAKDFSDTEIIAIYDHLYQNGELEFIPLK